MTKSRKIYRISNSQGTRTIPDLSALVSDLSVTRFAAFYEECLLKPSAVIALDLVLEYEYGQAHEEVHMR
jgi:hypothetical protein